MYETQGQCDYCDTPPGYLVNGLVPCACYSGIGASEERCRCPWGMKERQKAKKAALERDADGPRSVITRNSGEKPGAAGAVQDPAPKLPGHRESTPPQ